MVENYISDNCLLSTNMTTSVSRFLVKGSEIEVRFVDPENPDHLRWYCGVVEKVRYGGDANGAYAECDVFYEDGELVKEQRLYDDDFGDELWKFDTPLSNLIKAMKDEIEALQEENETDSNYDPDDDDDDTSECSDTSITDTKGGRPSIGDVMRAVIVHTSLITFASLAALRVLKGGCSDGIFPKAICNQIV
jgi:hypothetical protein